MTLATLHCPGCGAGVPLSAGESTQCRHCRAAVVIPPEWQAAAEAHAAAERVRREVEPRWRELTTGVGAGVEGTAMGLLLLLPPLLTIWAQIGMTPPPSPAENLGYIAFPALMPGALLWLWAATLNALVLRIRRSLRAREAGPRGDLGCRNCGAPLAAESDAPTATCLYCGTDSVVRDLPPVLASLNDRDHALRTLGEAAQVLKRRRVNLALGVMVVGCGVATIVAATAYSLSVALGL